ncbi:MAG: YcxB family protein [Lysobacteraceae bacterium]
MSDETNAAMTPDAVDIAYSLTYGEWLRAIWSLTLASPMAMAWMLAPLLFGLSLMLWLRHAGTDALSWPWIPIAVAALISPLMTFYRAHLHHRNARRQGSHRYRFDADGLEIRSANSELKQRWAAILRIRGRDGFLLLYFGKQHAHVIPRRALPAHDGEATLLRLARQGGVPRIDA